MKPFKLSFPTLMLRYYLMMAVVLIAGFTQVWLIAFLALPIFLSCLLAVKVQWRDMRVPVHALGRVLHVTRHSHSHTAA